MSALDVARKDFKGARRSRSLWTVATLLGAVTALIAFGYQGYQLSPRETVVRLFSTMGLLLAMLLPVVALVASYMAIAGERESGGVKFLLGLPNTRRDVFLGKLLSRLAVVAAGVTFMFATASAVAVARHGVLPAGVVVGMLAISLAYAAVFVAIAVALSSALAERSRAIAAAIGSYFLLVILYVVPGIGVSTVAQWVHTTMLGAEPNLDLYNAVTYTSPFIAYRKAVNLVLPAGMEQRVLQRAGENSELPAYLGDEVALAVFAVWLVVPLAIGYLRFEGADLE
ncbi:ABC transporter permease [Halomicroarcula limicola]|uniref:ABC transporter permease n=1 Tax=Haloarcula limicola TaxID=1429915 RepID=A0A8J8C3U3_9EURY|nr:ABC transporter permease subunit [Halomicroarcula limicola]MBV0923429.1 ABC transporter permease [Halomicroarcula limicola]